MNLDTVIELISLAFSEKFDGVEYNAKQMVLQPPTDHSQTMIVTDHEGKSYRIEVSKV